MRNRKKESLKTLQNKVTKKVAEFLAIYEKAFQKDVPGEEFEKSMTKLYKLAKKMNPDAKIVNLAENPKKVVN